MIRGVHTMFYSSDAELETRGVEFTEPVTHRGYGLVAHFRMPGGVIVRLDQPRYSKSK